MERPSQLRPPEGESRQTRSPTPPRPRTDAQPSKQVVLKPRLVAGKPPINPGAGGKPDDVRRVSFDAQPQTQHYKPTDPTSVAAPAAAANGVKQKWWKNRKKNRKWGSADSKNSRPRGARGQGKWKK